jgi:hypothetical protein
MEGQARSFYALGWGCMFKFNTRRVLSASVTVDKPIGIIY